MAVDFWGYILIAYSLRHSENRDEEVSDTLYVPLSVSSLYEMMCGKSLERNENNLSYLH